MKKILQSILLVPLVILISGCDTLNSNPSDNKGEKPLSFPTLPPCSTNLLQNDKSFICIQEHEGPDLIEANIKFESGSFTLNNQAKAVLYKLYSYLKLSNTNDFTIKGYAGKIDSKLISDKSLLTDSDLRLSKNRAISVREYLIKKGIEPDNITIQALGYQDPIAPNNSSTNRALNQRVEITLKSRILEQIDTIKQELSTVNPNNYTKFFSNVYLLNSNQLQDIARIYDSNEKRPVLASNFKIFANKAYTPKENKSNFIIISEPQQISSFNEDKKLYKLGSARYEYSYKDITALTIVNLSREAAVGDYVIPNDIALQKLPEQTFIMKSKITANVLEDVMNTNSFSSTYDNILLNKGTTDGLKVGAEMILYEPESRVDGFPVPPKFIGYGFVYRLSDHYSILLILNSLQEITSNSMATTLI